jgi:hypothetical protein
MKEKFFSALSLAALLTSLALPVVIALSTDAAAQSRGRGGASAGCPNGGYVNGKYKCNVNR